MKRFGVAFVFVATTVGCGSDDTYDSGGARRLTATLGAVGGSAMTGDATVRWTAGSGEFTAAVTIADDTPGVSRPWHVHFGTCEAGGDIVGPPGNYPALAVGDTGMAQASTTIAFELDAGAPYHVNVHESVTNLGNVLACGTLALASSGGGGDDDDDNGGGGGDDGDGNGYPY
jgi:hypothetical protein